MNETVRDFLDRSNIREAQLNTTPKQANEVNFEALSKKTGLSVDTLRLIH